MGRVLCKVVETEAEQRGYFAVRHAVFVEEQHIFADTDRDAYDEDAIHIVSVDQETGAVVGAVRCYEAEPGIWFGGRLAVLKAYRHHPGLIGARLCRLAEKSVIEHGAHRFLAYIQPQNVRFFERLHWRVVDEPVECFGRPHQLMEASLAGAKKIRVRSGVQGSSVGSV